MLNENFIHSKFIKIKYKIIPNDKTTTTNKTEKKPLYKAFMIQIKINTNNYSNVQCPTL